MKLQQFVAALESSPTTVARFVLPDGSYVPPHAHLTEVGHVQKNFIDCGGVTGRTESVLLQTHVGSDTDHRLKSGRFAEILKLANRLIPEGEFDVEVEYDCCAVSQYRIRRVEPADEYFDIFLGQKRTQCRAQERVRQEVGESDCSAAMSCC
jgi:Family of unknown function (DUF6428)